MGSGSGRSEPAIKKLSVKSPGCPSRQALGDSQTWIQQTVFLIRQLPQRKPPRLEFVRPDSGPLAAYINWLLNEWLPVEMARLLVNENATGAGTRNPGGRSGLIRFAGAHKSSVRFFSRRILLGDNRDFPGLIRLPSARSRAKRLNTAFARDQPFQDWSQRRE